MSVSRPSYRVMIFDFDGCVTLGLIDKYDPLKVKLNVENRFLSPAFLQLAKAGGYHFSVGCTHRCYYSMQKFYAHDTTEILKLDKEYARYPNPIDVFSWLTINIPKNFSELSGVECKAVSTPDDHSATAPKDNIRLQCGYGFKHILSVVEAGITQGATKYVVPEWKSTEHLPLVATKSKKLFSTKNEQIMQVLHYSKYEIDKLAQEKYGSDAQPILECHFFDDNVTLLNDVKNIDLARLPSDTILKCYQHAEAYGVCAKLDEPLFVVESKKTLLSQSSLFKVSISASDNKAESPQEPKPLQKI